MCFAQGCSAGEGARTVPAEGGSTILGFTPHPQAHHGPQCPLADRARSDLCSFCFCSEVSQCLGHCDCTVPRNSGTS